MDGYFGSNLSYCNEVQVSAYIYNLTSPYTDSVNRVSIVGTTMAMFTLSALFFNLTMFRRLSRSIRLARFVAVSLFPPVMSYLFCEAKNVSTPSISNMVIAEVSPHELPLRARLILTWLLLEELLHSKSEPAWVPEAAAVSALYSGHAVHAARIAWLGSLVFTSIQSPGRRALFGVLWSVAAAKMVQRLVIAEVIRRSLAAGRNHEIMTAYLPRVLQNTGCPLASCGLPVTGEDDVEKKTGPRGWVVVGGAPRSVVTVGEVWMEDKLPWLARRLCFSFALFKLLRRRLEDPRRTELPGEARACRQLILGDLEPGQLFRVLKEEVSFLSENYHSAVPVVLASPFFLVANYVVFPAAVLCVCVATAVACGSGDVPGTFRSAVRDNYVLSFGLARTAVCLLAKAASSLPAWLAAVDLSITLFLFVAFFYEEACQFLVLLLSPWFVVALACTYVRERDTTARCCRRRAIIRGIFCLGRCFPRRRRPLLLKQFNDVMRPTFWTPVALKPVPVSAAAEASIVTYLTERVQMSGGGAAAVLGSGRCTLEAGQCEDFTAWCEVDDGVARVILTWHVATSVFEARHPHRNATAAAQLSKYCAYLVAFRPELLPDDWNDVQHVYKTLVRELKEAFGSWGYYSLPCSARLDKLAEIAAAASSSEGIVRNGAVLGMALNDKVEKGVRGEEELWNMLAKFWVELLVYVAPAGDARHLSGHLATLVDGGEFVTLVWALTMHLGVNRMTTVPSPSASCEI